MEQLKQGDAPAEQQKAEKPVKKEKPKFEPPAEIEFPDFMKVNLKVARIIEAEPVEGSDKLMKLQVKIGEESRQIVAGIKKVYTPEDLIGRQVVVVYNLKPAKLMGIESQGMVLAADDADGNAILLQPDKEAPEGSSVH
ncbi:MAG: methionine--tRNA ligase subunit beta [Fimbriimonadaceae bacterium]